MEKHLWEIEHPYYGPDGDGDRYKILQDLLDGSPDEDMNVLYRFDWEIEGDPNTDVHYRDGVLRLFFIQPRRSKFWCPEIEVCQADEEKVKEFLKTKAEYLKKLWEPIIL